MENYNVENQEMEKCPQCREHCPVDNLQCGKGRKYFGDGGESSEAEGRGRRDGEEYGEGRGKHEGEEYREGRRKHEGEEYHEGRGKHEGEEHRKGHGRRNGEEYGEGRGKHEGEEHRKGHGRRDGEEYREGHGRHDGEGYHEGHGRRDGEEYREGHGRHDGEEYREGHGRHDGEEYREGRGRREGEGYYEDHGKHGREEGRGKHQGEGKHKGHDRWHEELEAGEVTLTGLMCRCGYLAERKSGKQRGQKRILQILMNYPQVSQKALQDKLGIEPGSMSEVIAKLEEKGLIQREKDESDRRRMVISLTEEGRAAAEQSGQENQGDEIFNVLSEEEKSQLKGILEKLLDLWKTEREKYRREGNK